MENNNDNRFDNSTEISERKKVKKETRKRKVIDAFTYTINRMLKSLGIGIIVLICIFLFCGLAYATLILDNDIVKQILSIF